MVPGNDLTTLEKHLDVQFKDRTLLETALTHRSYLNENPTITLPHNERLEFLGDAVLELAVTDHLYTTYNLPEGDLTNLRAAIVRGEMLSRIARTWDLDQFLRLSKGERRDTGKARQYILANAVEAVIGAVYLDQGYTAAQKLVLRDAISHLPEVMEQGLHIDAKSQFQELAQEQFRQTPVYTVLSERGPDHVKQFRVGAFLGSERWGEGSGTSKQEAEQAAARSALARISPRSQGTPSRGRGRRARPRQRKP
jgi:ribonuclease-3